MSKRDPRMPPEREKVGGPPMPTSEAFREYYERKNGEAWPVAGNRWPRGIGQFIEMFAEASADWMDALAKQNRAPDALLDEIHLMLRFLCERAAR